MSSSNGSLPKGLQFLKNVPEFTTQMCFLPLVVTPEVAQEMLKHLHPNQRKKKATRISLYAEDMRDRVWQETHEAVAFDTDANLIDGQNRLEGVVESGETVHMMVAVNVPKKSLAPINQGMSRTVVDAAHISKTRMGQWDMRSDFTSCGRAMYSGYRGPASSKARLSVQGLLAFCKEHEEAILFAVAECTPSNKPSITQAPVRAVLGRAFYGPKKNHTRIKEFGAILYSGVPVNVNKDIAAIRLRNWLMGQFQSGRRRRLGARPTSTMVYCRTQAALDAFINERKLDNLREVTAQELFLLPEEKGEE